MNKTQIACEHFDLTPAIRDHVMKESENFEKILNHNEHLEYFLSPDGHHHEFKALVRTRFQHRDLSASSVDRDLYKAVTLAARKLHAEILKTNKKHKEIRKRG